VNLLKSSVEIVPGWVTILGAAFFVFLPNLFRLARVRAGLFIFPETKRAGFRFPCGIPYDHDIGLYHRRGLARSRHPLYLMKPQTNGPNATMNEPNVLMVKYRIGENEEVEVPLHFEMSAFIPSVVAHHLSIQGTPDNVLIGFYEIEFPVLLSPTPEAVEKLKEEGYAAECVARVAIPNSRFKEFALVMAQVAGILPKQEGSEEDANSE